MSAWNPHDVCLFRRCHLTGRCTHQFISAVVGFLKHRTSMPQQREAGEWLLRCFKEEMVDTDPKLYAVVANVLLAVYSRDDKVIEPWHEVASEFASMLRRSESFRSPLNAKITKECKMFHNCIERETNACWCAGLDGIKRLETCEIEASGATHAAYIQTSATTLSVLANGDTIIRPPTCSFVEKVLAYQASTHEGEGSSEPSLKERLLKASAGDTQAKDPACILRCGTDQVVRLDPDALSELPKSSTVEIVFGGEEASLLVLAPSRQMAQDILDLYHLNNLTVELLRVSACLVKTHVELPALLCCHHQRILCELSLLEHSRFITDLGIMEEQGLEVEMGKKFKLPRVKGVSKKGQSVACSRYLSTLVKPCMAEYVKAHCSRELSLLVFYLSERQSCEELLHILSKSDESLSSSEFNMALLCAAQLNQATLRKHWASFSNKIADNLNGERLVWWAGFLSHHSATMPVDVKFILDILYSAEDKLSKLLLLEAAAQLASRTEGFDPTMHTSKLTALAMSDADFILSVSCIVPCDALPENLHERLDPDSNNRTHQRLLSHLGTKMYTSPAGKGELWSTAAWMKHFPLGHSEATESLLHHCTKDVSLTPIGILHYVALPSQDKKLENIIGERLLEGASACLYPLLEMWLATGRMGRLQALVIAHIVPIVERLSAEIKNSKQIELELLPVFDALLPIAVAQSAECALNVLHLKERVSGRSVTEVVLKSQSLSGKDVANFLPQLACFKELQVLNLETSRIGDQGAIAVAEYIVQEDVKLTRLSLGSTGIGTSGVFALAAALRQRPACLESLSLASNELSEQAAGAIAEVLLWNTKLTSLCLYDSGLSPKALLSITRALRFNSTLLDINLDNNCATLEQLRAVHDKLQLNGESKVIAPHLALAELKSSAESTMKWQRLYKDKPIQTLGILFGGQLDFALSRKAVPARAITA